MNKAQGLPISTIVIIILGVVVLVIGFIYILTSSGKSFDITKIFMGTGTNLTQNGSVQAGQAPSGGGVPSCKSPGSECKSDSDCCNPSSIRCFSSSFGDYQSGRRTCDVCITIGGFCSADWTCCSGLSCKNTEHGITAESTCG